MFYAAISLNLTGLIQTGSMCAQSYVSPAPGDLLRREGPGLLAVLFGVAGRQCDVFSTLHSGGDNALRVTTAYINLSL